jgi:hypothetical protein
MKHNNNLMPSSHAKCRCGRYATIGEWKAGIGLTGSYTCPDCLHQEFIKTYKPIDRNQYYRSFGIVTPKY